MPSWKKLIVSGSDANLNSLIVNNAVTASFFTGSFVGNLTGTATTASNITPAITSTGNNRILTDDGDGTLTAESNLTFDGSILAVNTNNLYVSGGRISVGTTSPSRNVDIESSTGTSVGIQLNSTGTGGRSYSFFSTNNGSSLGGGKFGWYDDTAQQVRVILDSSGNVGIAKSSPNAVFDVNGNSIITGSLIVTNGITGSLLGTASTASYVAFSGVNGLNTFSSSISGRVSTNESAISSLTAATSSYLLNTTDTLTGDLTVTGKLTAQEFHTEYVSASIIYESGSTKFGDTVDDIHSFTGSLQVSGARVDIRHEGSYISESAAGIRIRDTASSVGILFGVDPSLSASYIQSLDPGTSPSTRPLLLMPLDGGVVAIGTPTASTARLTVSGSISASGDLRVNTDTFFVNSSTNRVGVGTLSPSSIFDINVENSTIWTGSWTSTDAFTPKPHELTIQNGQDATTGSYAGIFFKAGETSASSQINAARIAAIREAGFDTALAFSVRSLAAAGMAEAVRITSARNVGIGTSTPSEKLTVEGNISGSGNITVVSLIETSKRELKENIYSIEPQLENIQKLNPVSFNFKGQEKTHFGFIVDEVEPIYPEFISDSETGINYSKMVSVLTKGIQELTQKVSDQQIFIDKLVKRISKLENK